MSALVHGIHSAVEESGGLGATVAAIMGSTPGNPGLCTGTNF